MDSVKKAAPARGCGQRHPGRLPLLVLMVIQILPGGAFGGEETADPYDVLYDAIMTRHGKDGQRYAENESSPALFTESEFPFDDKTYKTFSSALAAFEALPQSKIEAYSDVKRALMQRHLWKLFDATCPYRWVDAKTGVQRFAGQNHAGRRTAVQQRLASLIQRLALTKAQILALPDTRAITVDSGAFAQRHTAAEQFRPFLPADLYAAESSWVCLGNDEPIPADLHVGRKKWRSAFYSFMRLPQGRDATLAYLREGSPKDRFRAGSQVALIEQAFLISDQGELVLSPLIVSISLRAYVNVTLSSRRARPAASQCVAELVMQPRELMRGNAVMMALDPLDHRFEVSEKFICQDTRDPFETGRIPRLTRLQSCINCHNAAGKSSVLTDGGSGPGNSFATSPSTIATATSDAKSAHYTWQTLRGLWQVAGNDA